MPAQDDFGWANAGWHRPNGDNEVKTPSMDAMVREGIELDHAYAYKVRSEPDLASWNYDTAQRLPPTTLARHDWWRVVSMLCLCTVSSSVRRLDLRSSRGGYRYMSTLRI
eukprot:COSAG02_NODE_6628_length_3450_cov_3.031334_2_plen_110_part_00